MSNNRKSRENPATQNSRKCTTVPIKGMHCASCELLIEDELLQIPGVKKVIVSRQKANADIYYENDISVSSVNEAIEKAGYAVGVSEKQPWISRDMEIYVNITIALLGLFFLYNILSIVGIGKFLDSSPSKPTSIAAVLLIGLTAGVSTCMALIGGLVLGITAKYNQNLTNAGWFSRFKPHVFFNIGRIFSYLLLGGVIGVLGGVFQFSGLSLGLLTLAVALSMFTIGLQLTGISPRVASVKLTMPSSIARFLGLGKSSTNEYSNMNALVLGGATFFLPCGFTQAMQLYAMSTGSFWSGAMIMGVFAIGTTPGLLGIGGFASVVKGAFAQKFFSFSGVVVMLLAIYNAQNGLLLMGINPVTAFSTSVASTSGEENRAAATNGNLQVIKASYTADLDLIPNTFTVKKGIPVQLEIDAKADGVGCMGSIMIPRVTEPEYFEKGKKIIFTFTPASAGNLPLTCAMGVPWGNIKVI